jgi:hypothetical protein
MTALGLYRSRAWRRPPLWNITPSIVAWLPAFRRTFADWSPAQHARRVAVLRRLIARLGRQLRRAVDEGIARFGDGVLLSGGGRNHWPRSAIDACGERARAITTYDDALRCHAILARRRRKENP